MLDSECCMLLDCYVGYWIGNWYSHDIRFNSRPPINGMGHTLGKVTQITVNL